MNRSLPGHGVAQVIAYRGTIIEDLHDVSIAVVNAKGRLIASAGRPDRINPLRSTAKPFQALALLSTSWATEKQPSDEELALICASHVSSHAHLTLCRQLLKRLDVPESALGCGPHDPADATERHRLIRIGEGPKPIHNNCSGKHAAMLGAARAMNATLDDYLSPEHPVQARIVGFIQELSEEYTFPFGVDGCSAPTFGLSLGGLARAFAKLAAPTTAPDHLRAPLARVQRAMMSYPQWVAGEGVIDTVLMQAIPSLCAKRGARGCYGMALTQSPHGPLGVALKVEDGDGPTRTPIILAVLADLGVDLATTPSLHSLLRPDLHNCHGQVVGHLEAHLKLAWHQGESV